MSLCLSDMAPLHMLPSLRSECRDLGAIDASAGSINVLFCLFVCPQSPWETMGRECSSETRKNEFQQCDDETKTSVKAAEDAALRRLLQHFSKSI